MIFKIAIAGMIEVMVVVMNGDKVVVIAPKGFRQCLSETVSMKVGRIVLSAKILIVNKILIEDVLHLVKQAIMIKDETNVAILLPQVAVTTGIAAGFRTMVVAVGVGRR